jgi:AcrR family transcriptional regulator
VFPDARRRSFTAVAEDSAERRRLLDLVAGYCLDHGVADLTLRKAARAVGSNNRMLLYYFGSKEQMIATALVAAGDRFPLVQRSFEQLDGDGPLARRLDAAWRSLSADVNLPFIRLFFEVLGLAIHQPGRFDDFLGSVNHLWVDRVTAVLRREGLTPAAARRAGREVVAVWRGLQLDLVTGHERGPVDRAHAAAAARIAAAVAGA